MPSVIRPANKSRVLPRPTPSASTGHGGPQDIRKQPTKDVEYLFINKSPKSKNLSNCKADKTQTIINSHSQRFRGKSRHREDNTRLRLVPEAPSSQGQHVFKVWTSSPEEANVDKEDVERIEDADERPFDIYSGARSNPYRRRFRLVPTEVFEPILYSNNFREGDQCDPFSTSVTPIDKSTHWILQFFLDRGWKAHLKTVGKADETVWSQSFHNLSGIVRGCLSREVHMYALLTCNAMRMKCFGLGHVGKLGSTEQLMSKTLKALRLHFSNASDAFPINEQVILDIFFLAFSEFYRQDYGAMKTHLYMIRSMVGLFGGFEKISDYIREACCYTEICFATETGEPCVFDLTWDPGPFPESTWVRVRAALSSGKIKPMGSGFQNSLQDHFFDTSTRTAEIIKDLMVDIPALEFVRTDDEARPSDSWWACTRTRAVVHRLLSLAKSDKDKKPSTQELQVQCVTTTLIVYLCYENSYMTPLRSIPFILSRLKRTLRLSKSDFSSTSILSWGRHSEMLLWILITGYWLSGGGVDPDASWFLSTATSGCKALGLTSYEELQSLMDQFLWIEHLQTPSLMKLAGHVLIARAEEMEAEALALRSGR